MKLDAWLKQDHPLAERLLVVERLSQALNEVHDRGEPLAALQPEQIDVAGDGRCDLSGARRGTPAPGYLAPERAEGGPPSPESDIYAAGAIAWEVLAGSPCGLSPTHLSEARPELSQELADAVMACLERSPQWRPRDLTYLAQLAQHAQGAPREAETRGRSATPRPAGRAATVRSPRASSRAAGDSGSATRMRLAIGAVLALASAGGAAYFWLGRAGDHPRSAPPPPASRLAPNASAATPPSTLATPAIPATGAGTGAQGLPSSPPTAVTAGPTAFPSPRQQTPAAPTPAPLPKATATPALAAAPPTATATRTAAAPGGAADASSQPPAAAVAPSVPAPATVLPAPASSAPAAAAATAPAARPPVTLATVSPLAARRPGKVLLDLRGTGLHDSVRARLLPLREAPRGISVVRQKLESDTLMRVLLDLDAQVSPGAYAIVLEDAEGRQTKPLTFTVTR